jgi:hypothetical protein
MNFPTFRIRPPLLLDSRGLGASIAQQERVMSERSVFISSCSRRQMARRRPTPNAYRWQQLMAVIVLCAALAAFVAVRVGF